MTQARNRKAETAVGAEDIREGHSGCARARRDRTLSHTITLQHSEQALSLTERHSDSGQVRTPRLASARC